MHGNIDSMKETTSTLLQVQVLINIQILRVIVLYIMQIKINLKTLPLNSYCNDQGLVMLSKDLYKNYQ